jgi:hypothetical protein
LRPSLTTLWRRRRASPRRWARRNAAWWWKCSAGRSWPTQRGDTKAEVLLDWLDKVVRPAGPDGKRRWNDERVIVFTEYRDTQRWLQERLVARGLGGERLALLYGGMDADAREDVKARFQAEPGLDPVRILLATDAASEGIDLQRHCHRLVHYEIPWNPNRLEQRNGRIDRHGQTAPEVLVFHFVGAGWQQAAPGSLEGDLQFLWTVVEKVERIREDLGSVGPVIAEQVEEAMLGKRSHLDTRHVEQGSPTRSILKRERDLRVEITRLSQRLRDSQTELHLSPENIEHVISAGLQLARQPPLIPAYLTARVVPDHVSGTPTVVAHGRLVITGADGQRLHEELVAAGGALREGRFARLGVGDVDRLAGRRGHRRDARTELRRSILEELREPEHAQLQLFSTEERVQRQRDLDALRRRLEEIPGDIEAETAAIRARYASPTPRLFPAAITFLVPSSLAVARW